MTGQTFIRNCFFLLFICFITQSVLAAPINDSEIDYDITARVNPITRSIEGKSIITVKRPSALHLVLSRSFEVTQALLNGNVLGADREQTDQPYSWQIPFDFAHQHQFEIHWRGTLAQLDASLDHQQTLGRPVAVSSEIGTFLPDA
ncbi:MAG: M1 family peptidase, partial [Nitrosomonas sp.]|nr:M1 family peptidase [Nitrosomonas sp.]